MTIDEMENELSQDKEGLPEGWAEANFDVMAASKKHALKAGPFGSALKKNMYVATGYKVYGQEQVINSDEKIGSYYVDAEKYAELNACAVSPGDILVSLVGTAGKVLVLSEQCEPGIINPRLIKLSLHEDINRKYISLFIKSPTAQAYFKEQGHGGTMEILNLGILRKLPIPLPPLPEQIRIADKLDALLARVDAGRERLERVPKLVKQFRQAVLSAAVSGELTREWRGGGEAEWATTTVAAVAQAIFDGPFGSHLKSNDYTEAGVRVVRLENLGHLIFNESKKTYISEEKYQVLERHTLKDQDILFSSFVDEEIRACLYLNAYGRAINKADCFVVRCNTNKYLPGMMLYALSEQGTYHTFADDVHGATRPRINLKQLKQLEISLPPLPEQAEIVRRVEALFAIADRLEQRYQTALASFQRLTPALLAKAFRGELVPQDPNDEPASVLLERIRAQRAQGGRQKAEGGKVRATNGDGTEPKRRGRPPKAQAEGTGETAEPKRRGRPPGSQGIPTALNEEEAIRLLQERGQARAEGSRLVGLFED